MSASTQAVVTRAGLARRARELKLGLIGKAGEFRPVPTALTPWLITRQQWQEARRAAWLLGRLIERLARCPERLTPPPGPCNDPAASLPAVLACRRPDRPRARMAALMRHDLLLDRTGHWKWVETNVTAAGMGPFGEHAGLLQRDFVHQLDRPGAPVPNPASKRQAQFLVDAARGVHPRAKQVPGPLIVFAVDKQEDNRYDQDVLQAAIEAAGGRAIRLSLEELAQRSTVRNQRLCLPAEGCVDLVYFRTGYNLEQFDAPGLLDWRVKLEGLNIALCPTLDLQLAGSKWQQMLLERADDSLYRHLGFMPEEIADLRALMVDQHPATALDARTTREMIGRGWLLKSQREGGGSVLTGEPALAALADSIPADSVVMAPIESRSMPGPTPVLRDGEISTAGPRTAELGLFTAGESAAAAGYLVRSKPAGRLEAGIHAGHGMLDSLALIDSRTRHSLSLARP